MSDYSKMEKANHLPDEPVFDVSAIKRKFLNCPYGEDPRQVLDIYLPGEGCGPFPVVVYIHGGAWFSGHKADYQVIPFLGGIKRGYAVASINYRLVPHIRYPSNLYDIKSALRYLALNADSFLLDPSRTALCGSSAGAHLALMAAFTQGQAAFGDVPGLPICKVRAVVEQFGPTDFATIQAQFAKSGIHQAHLTDAPNPVNELLGVVAETIPNLLPFYNPIDNVHPDIPPVLLQHGKPDFLIPYQQAVVLYERIILIAGEGRAELDLSDELTHADPRYAEPEHVERVFGFIDRYLRLR